jgi:hypothetical protein
VGRKTRKREEEILGEKREEEILEEKKGTWWDPPQLVYDL